MLNGINELDTFFLDCKPKHNEKQSSLPDKVRVLHHPILLPIEFHGFISRTDLQGLLLFGYLISVLIDGMGSFK